MVFVVVCPNCKNTQRTDPKLKKLTDVSNKSKRCVYCGKSFKIHKNINDSQIVKVE